MDRQLRARTLRTFSLTDTQGGPARMAGGQSTRRLFMGARIDRELASMGRHLVATRPNRQVGRATQPMIDTIRHRDRISMHYGLTLQPIIVSFVGLNSICLPDSFSDRLLRIGDSV